MAIYRLYRGVDVRDVASAHVLALTARLGTFEIFNIAAHAPFSEIDCAELKRDAAAVISRLLPKAAAAFAARGWALPTSIDRVYVTDKARRQLRFVARHDFMSLLG
jgi:UDP-glucose 4-epimerase